MSTDQPLKQWTILMWGEGYPVEVIYKTCTQDIAIGIAQGANGSEPTWAVIEGHQPVYVRPL